MKSQQARYAAHVREFLALLYALKQFRCYLQGRQFTLLTDNAALAQIQSSRELNPMFARWFLLFEEFPCNVAHRPGKSLVPEDACSRIPSHHPLRPSATFDPDDEWAARDSFLSLPDFDPAGDREAARHARPVSAACPSDGSEAGCYAALAALRDAARDDGDAVVRDALHGRFDFASAAHWRGCTLTSAPTRLGALNQIVVRNYCRWSMSARLPPSASGVLPIASSRITPNTSGSKASARG